MLDDRKQKYPKVGVFLLVLSSGGKFLIDRRGKEKSFPFKELAGGETWEKTVKSIICELKLNEKRYELVGIGSGLDFKGESLVYSAFKLEVAQERPIPGFEWQTVEKAQELSLLSLESGLIDKDNASR
ncbi:MAG: hypothetical protein ACKN9V_05885 [Pseudomonadota bacterium]